MLIIVDYGMGNLRSVYKAVKALNAEVRISDDPNSLKYATKIILHKSNFQLLDILPSIFLRKVC